MELERKMVFLKVYMNQILILVATEENPNTLGVFTGISKTPAFKLSTNKVPTQGFTARPEWNYMLYSTPNTNPYLNIKAIHAQKYIFN